MTDNELKNLIVAASPPARDRVFELAVMARIERHQFRHAVLMNVAVSAALALVLAFAAPMLQQVWQTELAGGSRLLLGGGLLFASYLVLRLIRAEA